MTKLGMNRLTPLHATRTNADFLSCINASNKPVAVGPGNAQFMSIRHVSLPLPLLQLMLLLMTLLRTAIFLIKS